MDSSQWGESPQPDDGILRFTFARSKTMKTLDSFDFGSSVGRSSYDWDTILNGDINVLEAGVDFDCKPGTVKQRARTVAAKMGLKVRASNDKDGNIVIQSYEMTDAEKKFEAAKAKSKKTEQADDNDDEGEESPAPKRRRKAS